MDVNNRKKILVADNEISVRFLLKSLLDGNYHILEASDGEEAIDIAHREKPEIILMDILMPRLDGYTACYIIRKDPATEVIPVVILTALGQELNLKLAEEVGADGYITKPFKSAELLETVKHLLLTP